MLQWLKRFLGRPVPRPDLHFVMYTRQGCHLCDQAWTQLSRYQRLHRFHLQSEDVDANPEWKAKFNTCVPVVEINGKVRFRGQINEVLLQRLLNAKNGGS